MVGSAGATAFESVVQAAAAPAISVFVGYADSDRAGGEFPNPWIGAPGVAFDGCSPQSACTFDGGAIRIRNDNTTSVLVDGISVHIGTCLYTWSGTRYPVSLAAGAALIATQRASGVGAGCTGPDPSTFDSSDIPSPGICTNDGIVPVVDVTVDGATTSYSDTGQVLNTGGIDPGSCSNGDESTQWTKVGSKPCPGATLTLAPPTQTDFVGTTATLTATLTNGCGGPLDGVDIGFKVTAGPNSGVTGSGLTDATGAAGFTYSSAVIGTDSVQAAVTNAVGFSRTSNLATVTWIVPFAPGGGSFVIGNNDAKVGSDVNFWGAHWAWHNSLSGGLAPRSFKGFADQPAAPACGQTWTAEPGNSTPPPDGPLPQLMAVIVTSSAQKTGPELSGDIAEIVVVKTNAGYEPNPGHAGTGVVVAVICGGPAATTTTTTTSSPPAQQNPAAPPRPASAAPAGPGGNSTSTACPVGSRSKAAGHACSRTKRQ